MTPDELTRLEALAKAATPGDRRSWRAGNSNVADGRLVGNSEVTGLERPYNKLWIGWRDEENHRKTFLRDEDADFIAAANPQTLFALVAEVRRLSGDLARAVAVVEAARAGIGIWTLAINAAEYLAHAKSRRTLAELTAALAAYDAGVKERP